MTDRPAPEPTFYATPEEWRAWPAERHAGAREQWVGFHRRATGCPTMTWPESVDEALRTDEGTYSYDHREAARFDPERERRLRANAAEAAFFAAQPPGYRRTATHWVMSARREETRDRRLAHIADSAAGRRIGPLARAS